MLRRHFLQIFGAAALAQSGPQPGVLLIVAEGWRGWPPEQTTNLQRLQKESLYCTRAYATCPQDESAHAVLSSGMFAHAIVGQASTPAAARHSLGGGGGDLQVASLRSTKPTYDARILDMDRQLGAILDKLNPQSPVIFTATSGDLAGAHGTTGADEPYEESARVPLVFRFPGMLTAGTSSDILISHVDIYPTVLGFLQRGPDPNMQGRDWSTLLRTGKGERPESVFCQGKLRNPTEWRMVVRGFDKLVTDREGEPTHLFNIAQDPMEIDNLVDLRAHLRKKDELSALLQIWRKKTNDGRSASGLRQRK
ncbi:MAG: sulfatase-like hydrolase/transferase [Bryobacterales bacterium]|nr:sulfatase-like hydrolase/transferase [Bryobacterales bacterium]